MNQIFWSFGSLVLTIWQAVGLRKQNKRIWNEQSGESLSLAWIGYFIVILTSQMTYAFIKSKGVDWPLFINGFLQVIFSVTIFMGWYHFERASVGRKERIILWFLAAVLIAAVITLFLVPPGLRYVVFLAIVSAGIITNIGQAIKIFRQGRGVIDISMLIPQWATNVYWSAYAFVESHDKAFQIIGPTFSVIFGASIIIWLSRKPNKTKQ